MLIRFSVTVCSSLLLFPVVACDPENSGDSGIAELRDGPTDTQEEEARTGLWRRAGEELGHADEDEIVLDLEGATAVARPFSTTVEMEPWSYPTQQATFTDLPLPVGGSAPVVEIRGALSVRPLCSSGGCYTGRHTRASMTVFAGPTSVETLTNNTMEICSCTNSVASATLPVEDIDAASTTVHVRPRYEYSGACGTYPPPPPAIQTYFCRDGEMTLSYEIGEGRIESERIVLSEIGGETWDELTIEGEGHVRVHVTDARGNFLDDDVVAGNSAGLAPGVHDLSGLDPRVLPGLALVAQIEGDGHLRAWQVSTAGLPPAPIHQEHAGLIERGESVHYETREFGPGSCVVDLEPQADASRGDADLYVAVGRQPSLSEWDCRPYRWGTDERCDVTVSVRDQVFVMVHGYEDGSDFELTIDCTQS